MSEFQATALIIVAPILASAITLVIIAMGQRKEVTMYQEPNQPVMSWKEFKDSVDKALEEMGINETEGIWFIDVSFPEKEGFAIGRISVTYDDTDGISVR
jgi:hypothetical protein